MQNYLLVASYRFNDYLNQINFPVGLNKIHKEYVINKEDVYKVDGRSAIKVDIVPVCCSEKGYIISHAIFDKDHWVYKWQIIQKEDSMPTEKQHTSIKKTAEDIVNHLEMKEFSSGAKRSKDADEYRFDLIHPIFEERLAKVFAEGARKYGDYNYEKGIPAMECINHLLRHINEWLKGNDDEDHLGHAAANICMAMQSLEIHPEINQGKRRKPGCLPPNETN